MAYKTVVEDNIDVLVAGAGLGGTGAASTLVAAAISATAVNFSRRAC